MPRRAWQSTPLHRRLPRLALDRSAIAPGGRSMPDRTYKLEEIVGVSETSTDDAIRNALARAAQTLQGLDWFEVVETRGTIQDGSVAQFQVTIKIGFRVLSPEELQR